MMLKIDEALSRLQIYCEEEEFKGWDPYDGLNSKLFQSFPFLPGNRFARLAWIQAFKRSPVNFRKFALVKKDYNAKGVALFLAGYCNLFAVKPKQGYSAKINFLCNKLLELQSSGWSGSCWGYNFDWQARAFFQPKNTPTVVATVFAANALMDAYEITGDGKLLDTARSSCNFILKDLNRTYDKNKDFSFSYSPLDKSVVFNASLLGSRLLSRVYSFTGERVLKDEAEKSIKFCLAHQRNDGSWSYGTLPFHQWVDSFHTGYNLECIAEYCRYTGDTTRNDAIEKGFRYYIQTFFTKEGISRYYNHSVYPIDIHSSAQLIITLSRLNKIHEYKKVADKVLSWTIDNMQADKGYFYYQINKFFITKIPYIRWAQAWMFYSLTTYQKIFTERNTLRGENEGPFNLKSL